MVKLSIQYPTYDLKCSQQMWYYPTQLTSASNCVVFIKKKNENELMQGEMLFSNSGIDNIFSLSW